nr:immunoglobulin heavy chain junction region [Mus musculus]
CARGASSGYGRGFAYW